MKYIVLDIGGTFIKHAVMDENFNEEQAGETPTEYEPERFLEQLVSVIKSYGDGYGGVAISMAGFINPESGENTDYGCSERFTKYNLKEVLAQRTGYRISIENDSNCAALAESVLGAGNYAVKDSFQLFTRRDHYLHTTQTRRRIEQRPPQQHRA